MLICCSVAEVHCTQRRVQQGEVLMDWSVFLFCTRLTTCIVIPVCQGVNLGIVFFLQKKQFFRRKDCFRIAFQVFNSGY